ncbi:hypothetical protein PG993_004018 [Apiospora rasikravindrae]|uniref:Uncharacterized protein n=1 Tax=Apiospora rasikravindrae TaxID=990691 RepID=A0ABR1TBK1_9PEZI
MKLYMFLMPHLQNKETKLIPKTVEIAATTKGLPELEQTTPLPTIVYAAVCSVCSVSAQVTHNALDGDLLLMRLMENAAAVDIIELTVNNGKLTMVEGVQDITWRKIEVGQRSQYITALRGVA